MFLQLSKVSKISTENEKRKKQKFIPQTHENPRKLQIWGRFLYFAFFLPSFGRRFQKQTIEMILF